MKIYDTHSDVFSNLYERKLQNKENIFNNYHVTPMRDGEIAGGIWVVYSEHDFDIHEAYKIALNEFEPFKNQYDVYEFLSDFVWDKEDYVVAEQEELPNVYNISFTLDDVYFTHDCTEPISDDIIIRKK